MQSLVVALLQLLALSCASMPGIRYVKLANQDSFNCSGQPCKTLDQYIRQTDKFFIAGSTFSFLPGIHSLQYGIALNDTSNITLTRADNDSNVTIVCTTQYTITGNNVSNLSIKGLTFDLTDNQWLAIDTSERWLIIDPREYQDDLAAAVKIYNGSDVIISDCTFLGSGNISQTKARALYTQRSHITILRNIFTGNSGGRGGAIYASISSLILSGNVFTGNSASYFGGAVFLNNDSKAVFASHNRFSKNFAVFGGGAINCEQCSIVINGNSYFEGNYLTGSDKDTKGGAIRIDSGHLKTSGTVMFSNNVAIEGGAIFLDETATLFGGQTVMFSHNSAKKGGGMSLIRSSVKTDILLEFVGNSASKLGGGLSLGPNFVSDSNVVISANFTQNKAECGGAISVYKDGVIFVNTGIEENSGSAVCISDGNVSFKGTTRIFRNLGFSGGAIRSKDSVLTFSDVTRIEANSAFTGGAISSTQGGAVFSGIVQFTRNRADSNGGAIYALGSSITFRDNTVFDSNSAVDGGAMYFLNSATMIMTSSTQLNTFNNSASEHGGVIYHKDTPTTLQCNFTFTLMGRNFEHLPYCFLQTESIVFTADSIHCQENQAGRDGTFLFGGLLTKCRPQSGQSTVYGQMLFVLKTFNTSYLDNANSMSSEPYELHFCESNEIYNYTRSRHVEMFRGQKLSVPLLATAQGKTRISAEVTAITHSSRLTTLQNTQTLPGDCSNLSYNLYSTEEEEELILYPNGPCRDSELARITLHVTFLPCPEGLTQSGEACICEKRLQPYNVDCLIDDLVIITKKTGSNFWMSMLRSENGSYGGLILYGSCPAEYCRTQAVNVTLDNLDVQCDLNRSGVLCGECASNHSLMLGSSRCEICSNTYLALLPAFAAAGIALVAFLIFLKLTVATGALNSIILYANIIQVNRRVFFPLNKLNILMVFIAWLNLDLGVETCFYNGMTSYIQTWLQFVFPVYIWVLISTIIFFARRSVLLSRIIGSDPIAVLATLLLMSYTKILRVIIDVYSSAYLDYPGEEKIKVWLKDGSIPYLSPKHLALTVVTSTVLVVFFIPYTVLLLLGHRLYRYTGRKYFYWFNRIKPFLESYYAPYKPGTRYWTGFLLLVRCTLYIVFSFGGRRESLLAIVIIFTALGFLSSGRVYKNGVSSAVEMFVNFNLVILSAATQGRFNSPELVYALVGLVFAIMISVIVYQFHLLYVAKTKLWLVLKTKVCSYAMHIGKSQSHKTETPAGLPIRSQDRQKNVSKTVVDLREPLLEMNP